MKTQITLPLVETAQPDCILWRVVHPIAGGPFGERPPAAYRSTSKRNPGTWNPLTSRAVMHDKDQAIILMWDGRINAHGCDWVQEILMPNGKGHRHWFRAVCRAFLAPDGSDERIFLRDYRHLFLRDYSERVVLLGRE